MAAVGTFPELLSGNGPLNGENGISPASGSTTPSPKGGFKFRKVVDHSDERLLSLTNRQGGGSKTIQRNSKNPKTNTKNPKTNTKNPGPNVWTRTKNNPWGLSPEELARENAFNRKTILTNIFCAPYLVCLYLAMGFLGLWWFGDLEFNYSNSTTSNNQSDYPGYQFFVSRSEKFFVSRSEKSAFQPEIFLLQIGLALSLHAATSLIDCPHPPQKSSMYQVCSKIGKVIYLTRHGVWLQVIHFIFSFCIEFWILIDQYMGGRQLLSSTMGDGQLLSTTIAGSTIPGSTIPGSTIPGLILTIVYRNSMFCGLLSTVVTILYFALVTPDNVFKEEAMWYQKYRKYDFVGANWSCHFWGLPLAILDIFFIKYNTWLNPEIGNEDHNSSKESFSSLGKQSFSFCVLQFLIFTIYYVGLLFINNKLTGVWPYGIVEKVNQKGFIAWIIFIGFICVFVAIFIILYLTILKWGMGVY